MSKEITSTSSFTKTSGFEVKAGSEFEVSLPFIANTKIKLEIGHTSTATSGTSKAESKTIQLNLTIKVPPWTTVRAEAALQQREMEVKYVISFRSGRYQRGIWKGVDVHHSIVKYVTVK